ncbi:MAG: hypothetical protein B6226_05505 [Candidatus Cloacimonetes bacterium 4572_65]|nr:MAG: hypothetical protein B6226_05505 [Candidatus Cloacimonetes bacterium 4572_65]
MHGVNRFEQDKNFLYFTGLEIPNARFVAIKVKNKVSKMLFIEKNIPERVVWEGAKTTPEEATAISTIQSIKFMEDFNSSIVGLLAMSEVKKVFVNYEKSALGTKNDERVDFANSLKNKNPELAIGDFLNIVRPLRQIKDAFEIEQLQKAIDITAAGLNVIFTTAKAGMFEFAVESMLYNEMLSNGYRFWGFTPIVACGVNAATLHYSANNTQIEENEMVLCDVGASCYGYSADISRTFPIGEKFEPRSKEVYEEVLNVQKVVIDMIKPGVSMLDLNTKTNEMISKACIKLGLIKEAKEFRKYYMHSIGHHLGLDTHDVGTRDSVLEAGMVITVEPGLYIAEEKIGVRIEDDILVTETGYKILSEAIPKEVADLEKLRQVALK